MNARHHASSAPPVAAPHDGNSGASTVASRDAGKTKLDAALIALARMLARQAAAEFMRLGLPPHASTLEDLQNA
jgi:hypothetical protein